MTIQSLSTQWLREEIKLTLTVYKHTKTDGTVLTNRNLSCKAACNEQHGNPITETVSAGSPVEPSEGLCLSSLSGQ